MPLNKNKFRPVAAVVTLGIFIAAYIGLSEGDTSDVEAYSEPTALPKMPDDILHAADAVIADKAVPEPELFELHDQDASVKYLDKLDADIESALAKIDALQEKLATFEPANETEAKRLEDLLNALQGKENELRGLHDQIGLFMSRPDSINATVVDELYRGALSAQAHSLDIDNRFGTRVENSQSIGMDDIAQEIKDLRK